ncbi:MAG TPA: SAM-dependent methyltransferase [Flavobacteriales bacterium]|nr:SAM-dependent methyltransferase [Flavobacteriales bacterium]
MTKSTVKGKIYLVPSPIEDHYFADYLPLEINHVLNAVDYFIVEELKTARRFIKKINKQKNIDACLFHELNEHTNEKELAVFIQPVLEGRNAALVSEAGCPGVADPGQNLIALAHKHNIEIIPLVGPSSLLLALMSSGLNGQQFKFNGYLPKEQKQRKQKLKDLEHDTHKTGTTHLFIETPYRNNHLMGDMLSSLNAETKICVACEIKSAQQFIKTKTVKDWKTQVPDLDKRNTVFLIGR